MTEPNQIVLGIHTENQIKAACDLFGNDEMVIRFNQNSRIPNRWIRFWSKVFFNSKWTLINDNEHNNQKVGM